MKRIASCIIIVSLISQLVFCQTQPQGTGSSESPFQVSTPDELLWISMNQSEWDKNVDIINDIDLSVSKSWDNEKGFMPIGNKHIPYTGSFNGNNKSISGLTINRPDSSYIALIGYAGNGAAIQDVKIENAEITGFFAVGSVIGMVDSLATLANCSATGNVKGKKGIGGLAGRNKGSISSGTANVTVYASRKWCGGFVGINDGTVSSANASGNVSGGGAIGGFVGLNRKNGLISECFATGNADGVDKAVGIGGFAGIVDGGIIKSCYSSGKAGGASNVGGFAGGMGLNGAEIIYCYTNGSVKNVNMIVNGTGGFIGSVIGKIHSCYSTATISASGGYMGYGGFAGVTLMEDIKSCYFDAKPARAKNSLGNNKNHENITSLKTKQFAQKESFEGWQFNGDKENPWIMPAGATSPKLYWQE